MSSNSIFQMTIGNAIEVTVDQNLRMVWKGNFHLGNATYFLGQIQEQLILANVCEGLELAPNDRDLSKMGWHQTNKLSHWSDSLTQYLKVKEVKVEKKFKDRSKAQVKTRTSSMADTVVTPSGHRVSIV